LAFVYEDDEVESPATSSMKAEEVKIDQDGLEEVKNRLKKIESDDD
jgi:hypothetical protein